MWLFLAVMKLKDTLKVFWCAFWDGLYNYFWHGVGKLPYFVSFKHVAFGADADQKIKSHVSVWIIQLTSFVSKYSREGLGGIRVALVEVCNQGKYTGENVFTPVPLIFLSLPNWLHGEKNCTKNEKLMALFWFIF